MEEHVEWVIEKDGKYMTGTHFGKSQRTTFRWSKDARKAFLFNELNNLAYTMERMSKGKIIPRPTPAVTVVNINSGTTTTGKSAMDFIRRDMR